MKGHFKKRGERWYFWAELEPGPDGKRRQVSKGGFRTKREAEAGFAEFRDQQRSGTYVAPKTTTVGSFLVDEWLPAIRASVRPSTLDHYSGIVRAYVVPALGGVKIQSLTPARLNAFYATLLSSGKTRDNTGLTPKSVRHVHTTLHKAFHDAVRWGVLARNPADLAEPPRPATAEMKVWTPTEMRAFLDAVADDRLYAAWILIATTGMRRGEVLGLRWSDVDLDHGRASVVQTLTTVRHVTTVSEPKTAKGRRAVALDPATTSILRAHRKRQLEERMAAGPAWTDTGRVFTREDGTDLRPETFSRHFDAHALRAGLPRIRLHDLRHSYATAALSAGIAAKVVSERLGHANVQITLDTYSHVLPSIQQDAADAVARLILGGDD